VQSHWGCRCGVVVSDHSRHFPCRGPLSNEVRARMLSCSSCACFVAVFPSRRTETTVNVGRCSSLTSRCHRALTGRSVQGSRETIINLLLPSDSQSHRSCRSTKSGPLSGMSTAGIMHLMGALQKATCVDSYNIDFCDSGRP